MTKPTASAEKQAETIAVSSLEAAYEPTSAGFSAHPPAPDAEDELVGAVLNETYVVERCIGEGGMGRVYEARHTRITNKRFAIKVLLPEFARNAEVMVRFQREAEATASIAHPNVIGVYDVDRTPQGLAYLVCDLLLGVDLSEHLEKVGRLTWQATVRIGVQLCDALAAAHARGVIHRDLKPQNIYLLGDRAQGANAMLDIRVLDFGLSRFADGADDQLTKTGFIMGTPSYMSPEQAHGQRGDHRIDIYGAGAILYAALTGNAPFEASTPQLTVLAVMGREPARLRSIEPNIPASLELIVQHAMAKKPEDRYQDFTSMLAALATLDTPPSAGLARAPAESSIALETQGEKVESARPKLIGLLALIVFVLVSVFAVAVAGIELSLEHRFSPTEFTLLMLVALGTALTPSILIIARLRRAWGNSARVLGYLDRLYPPLIAGMSAYGLAGLLVRLADDVLTRYGWSPLGVVAEGSTFRGWDLLLSLIGLVAAGAAILYDSQRHDKSTRFRRLLLAPTITFGAVCISALLLLLGGLWRLKAGSAGSAGHHSSVATNPALSGPHPLDAATTPPANAQSLVPRLPTQSAQPAPTAQPAHPSDTELAQAIALGVDGLVPLAERYPKEPLVLSPLFHAFASRAVGRADAMAIAKRLLEVSPSEALDRDFGIIIKSAASTPGRASEQAFELMARSMGSTGLDLLFELSNTNPKLKAHADKLLSDPTLRAAATPALSVAYQLREAETCEARLPLLARAAGLGDERSIQILNPLATGAKRGCGKWKNKPCPASCAKEAEEFKAVMVKIRQRLGPSH